MVLKSTNKNFETFDFMNFIRKNKEKRKIKENPLNYRKR